MKPNILARLLILLTDGLFSFFLFQIIAGLAAYFYFIPNINGFLVTWICYYIISYLTHRRTFGQYFFNAEIIDNGNKHTFALRLLLREATCSLPAVILLLFGWNYLSPVRTLILIPVCAILAIFRKKIFRITVERRPSLKPAEAKHVYRNFSYVFLLLIISATIVRIINTVATNDRQLINERPLYATPFPSGHSVQKYVDFLKNNQSDINDYLFKLFEKYDHVILCERHHKEMTQYDMIYDFVTDPRFTDSIGTVFTEIGCAESRDAYKAFTDTDFTTDEEVEKNLASFMTKNQSVHLLWPNTNWFNFLKRMYYFNHDRSKRVNILFSDRNWLDRTEMDNRDSIMADNIISTLKSDSLHKSLIIMNYRHAYLTPGNCGYYLSRAFPGKVANVMINFASMSKLAFLTGEEIPIPVQYGKWDVAFEQLGNPDCAFDFEGSPFGEDSFDHFILPWDPVCTLPYKDMFTGFIHYKSPAEQFTSDGYNHILDPENEKQLRIREKALKGYSLNYWKRYLKDGIKRQDGIDVYYESNLIENKIYIGVCLLSLLLLGIMDLISFRRIRATEK